MKTYAGIGSRETPKDILEAMDRFAFTAARRLILRSGGADGADTAFEVGCIKGAGDKEIFLPWKGFNKNPSVLIEASAKAHEVAATIHPSFKYMRRPAKLLVARNMHQILGQDLNTPVEFVVCWTKDGCESLETYSRQTGGTGSAIALASKCGIPVYNLCNKGRLGEALEHLKQYPILQSS